MSDRELGIVKWFEDSRGYGFIKRDGGGDVFVHSSGIEVDGHRTLERGQSVEFRVIQGSRGPKASRVVPYTRRSKRDGQDCIAGVRESRIDRRTANGAPGSE